MALVGVHSAALFALQDEALEAVASGRSLQDTLGTTAAAMVRLVPGSAVAFFMLDEAHSQLLLLAESELEPATKIRSLRIDLRQLKLSPVRAFLTRRPSYGFLADPDQGGRKALAIPIENSEGQLAGSLILQGTTASQRNLVRGLLAVAGQIFRIAERRQRFDREVEDLRYYDTLTGFPNRLRFEDVLRHRVAEVTRSGTRLGLSILNVDHFRTVHEGLGHQVGEDFLRAVASRLRKAFGANVFIARLGVDEFAILLAPEDGEAAANIATQAIGSITRPLMVSGHSIRPSASLGYALFPDDAEDPEELTRLSHLALQQAKGAGGSQTVRANPDAGSSAREMLALEQVLQDALERGRFLLLYQPRVDLRTQRTVAFEALARLRYPDGRLASAGEFIEVLESRGGLRDTFTHWLIQQIAQLQIRRAAAGERLLPISMNIPALALAALPAIADAAADLDAKGLPRGLLRVELVERELSRISRVQFEEIDKLAAQGVDFELDDFGTAEANFDLLPRLPLMTLKLAGAMTSEVALDPRRAKLVGSIAKFAESYGLRLCSEQVETLEQLKTLEGLGVQEVQGFYLSQPLAEADMAEATLRSWTF